MSRLIRPRLTQRRPIQSCFAIAAAFVCIFLLSAQTASAQTFSVVYSFFDSSSDASTPVPAHLVQDTAGNFYGLAEFGGSHDKGAIYKIDPSGTETVLYSFTGGADGGSPQAGLYLDSDGTLYGLTDSGGDTSCSLSTSGCGTIFKFDTSGTLTTLHTFKNGADGAYPLGNLISVNGALYGVAEDGSPRANCNGCGLIFKITKTGTFTVVYAFTGGTDGGGPNPLVRDAAGNIYGAASYGVSGNLGTIFKLDTSKNFSVLYTFPGGAAGAAPEGKLIIDVNGNIHGTTYSGGDATCNCGVVFRLDAAGDASVLHIFRGYPDGIDPAYGLIDAGGVLYGTTYGGGDSPCDPGIHGCGVLFEISKTGQYSVLHRFSGSSDDGGFDPSALMLGADGSIYGTTSGGGENNKGAFFKWTP
jgi:uncharacterized repeat protein (TIGR03803 family)